MSYVEIPCSRIFYKGMPLNMIPYAKKPHTTFYTKMPYTGVSYTKIPYPALPYTGMFYFKIPRSKMPQSKINEYQIRECLAPRSFIPDFLIQKCINKQFHTFQGHWNSIHSIKFRYLMTVSVYVAFG